MNAKVSLCYIFLVLLGCSTDSNNESNHAPTPTISSLSFLSETNSILTSDIVLTEANNIFKGRSDKNVSVTDLTASFQFSGKEVTVDGVIQESGSSRNDFTDIVTYTVSNRVGVAQTYTVDLTKFTGLPILNLVTDNFLPINSKENYLEGSISIDGGRGFDDFDTLKMKIRGRGNSTWVAPKKPYQLKLYEKSEFLGMPSDKKWIFLAEYSDKTMLRNMIAFELGYISNLDWTPEGEFSEVFINNEYNGTYLIAQKVEESDNRVKLGDTGYLLELDQLTRLDPDDVFFESIATDKFIINIKEPELDFESSEYSLIVDQMGQFESALFGEMFTSDTQGYAQYIDINSFVDWFLISEITKNVDSKDFSSMYVNVLPGKKIKMGPLWDFDRAFGNASYSESRFTDGWWVKDHHWYERLFQDPIFVELVKIRFDHFKKNRGMILEKIDEYSDHLKYAQKENDTKWMTIGNLVWPNPEVFDTYAEDVEHLKEWLSQRMEWLDVAISDL